MFKKATTRAHEHAAARQRHDVDVPRAMLLTFDSPDAYFEFFSASSPRLPSRKRDGIFPDIAHAACLQARMTEPGRRGMRDARAGGHPETAAIPDALANPPPMTHAEIRAELAKIFRVPRVSDLDLIIDYVEGGPVAIAALRDPLAEWPAFGERDLRVRPDELRMVTTIGELVDVIDRALRQAARDR